MPDSTPNKSGHAPRPAPLHGRVALLVVLAGTVFLAPFVRVLAAHHVTVTEREIVAAYLYRFATQVEWPYGPRAESLVIAVVGAPDVAEELRRRLPDPAQPGALAVRVEAVDRPQAIAAADLVYVGGGTAAVRAAVATFGTRPTLVVGEDEDALLYGAAVAFRRVDDRVRFAVSMPALERAGLRVRAGMLTAAVRVER